MEPTLPQAPQARPARRTWDVVLSIALLVVAMGIGVAIVRQWKDGRERSGADAAVPGVAVLAHGALALATLVVVVIAAVGAR